MAQADASITGAHKKIAFVTRRNDLSPVAFARHWRERHGPLLASIPEYRAWRRSYVQSLIIARGPVGGTFPFDGIAEFLLPAPAANETDFSATDFYRTVIQPDEARFVDSERTIAMNAWEHVLIAGKGAVKVVVVSRRAPGINRSEFEGRLMNGPQPDGLRGRVVNWIVEGSFKLPGAREAQALPVDCVETLWFGSVHYMKQYFEHEEALTAGLFAERQSFIADEVVLFNQTQT